MRVLMAALQELPEEVSNDPLDLNPSMADIRADFFNSEASTQAGYGLTELGAVAVPALIEAVSTSDAPLIRSRAIDVLGDIDSVTRHILDRCAFPLHRPADGPPPPASRGED